MQEYCFQQDDSRTFFIALLETPGRFAKLMGKSQNVDEPVYTLEKNQYYVGGDMGAVIRGVKIHISGTWSSKAYLGEAILPYLIEKRVLHKVLVNIEYIDKAKNNNQCRKFITIYPEDAKQLGELVDGIDKIL